MRGAFFIIAMLASVAFAQEATVHGGSTRAETIQLPILKMDVDLGPLFELADKNENEIVEILRKKHGIKVVILPEIHRNGVPNQAFTIGNNPDEEAALKFYAHKKKGPLRFDPSALAIYMGPYSSNQEAFLDPKEMWDRPFMSEPVIVARLDANREVLMHEFLHYLISQARAESTVEVDGKKMDKQRYLNMQAERAKDKAYDILDQIDEEEDPAKKSELEQARHELLLASMNNRFEELRRGAGEELDITRILVENAERLNLQHHEAMNELAYHGLISKIYIDERDEIETTIDSEIFRKHAATEEARKLLSSLRANIGGTTPILAKDLEWYSRKSSALRQGARP